MGIFLIPLIPMVPCIAGAIGVAIAGGIAYFKKKDGMPPLVDTDPEPPKPKPQERMVTPSEQAFAQTLATQVESPHDALKTLFAEGEPGDYANDTLQLPDRLRAAAQKLREITTAMTAISAVPNAKIAVDAVHGFQDFEGGIPTVPGFDPNVYSVAVRASADLLVASLCSPLALV